MAGSSIGVIDGISDSNTFEKKKSQSNWLVHGAVQTELAGALLDLSGDVSTPLLRRFLAETLPSPVTFVSGFTGEKMAFVAILSVHVRCSGRRDLLQGLFAE